MTTPTLSEAADIVGFVGAKESYIDWAVSDKQRDAFRLAANTLRALADAQSDAEKGYKSWFFENIRAAEGVHVNSDGSTMMRSELIDQAYLAGHAQGYAAGIAASPSDVSEHLQEMWRKSVCFLRDQLEAKKRALAAQEAKCKELEAELATLQGAKIYQSRMHTPEQNGNCFATCLTFLLNMGGYDDMPQWDKELEWADYYMAYQEWLAKRGLTSCRMEGHPNIDGYYIASGPSPRGTIRHSVIYKNGALFHDPHPSNEGIASVEFVEILVDVGWSQSFYEAALATAKADALELAKEVRRCHALAQDADDRICEGDVAGFALFGDACHEMIDDRPDTVITAMERYK